MNWALWSCQSKCEFLRLVTRSRIIFLSYGSVIRRIVSLIRNRCFPSRDLSIKPSWIQQMDFVGYYPCAWRELGRFYGQAGNSSWMQRFPDLIATVFLIATVSCATTIKYTATAFEKTVADLQKLLLISSILAQQLSVVWQQFFRKLLQDRLPVQQQICWSQMEILQPG